MESFASKIHFPSKTQYHTNYNDSTVNITGRSTYVAPPLHRYPTRSKFIEDVNHIATVTTYAILYPVKPLMNAVIRHETRFAQKYRHLVKGDEKTVCHKSFSD